MKIGVLYTAYNCLETLEDSLRPWVLARAGGVVDDILIAAVSVPFKEYKDIQVTVDATTNVLRQYRMDDRIDYLHSYGTQCNEAEARNFPLDFLLSQKVDYVLLVDGDEVFTLKNIKAILEWVHSDPFTAWHSLSYKNFIFDKNHYLEAPFTPPRVFKTNVNDLRIHSFFWDNDIIYTSKDKIYTSYKSLPSGNIPPHVAHIDHYTWLNNEKTRAKVAYQVKHFGHCSYRWNEEKNTLEIDPSFYSSRGLPTPKIIQENA